MNGTKHDLSRGDHLVVPHGATHHFINLHPEEARALIVMSPATIGPKFFRETAVIVNSGGPPDLKRVAEVMLRHGLVPVP